MKIGIISDTHLHNYSLELKRLVDTYFGDVDMVMHAGDIVEMEVLDAFLTKKIEVVAGNMDPASVRNHFPVKKIIKVEAFKIGLIHGWGSPVGLENRISNEFTEIDCLVYGHTHYPVNQIINGVLFFNPGSATEKRFTKRNTVGILEISERIMGKLIEI
jgi:putative phosphoesterase